PPALSRTRPPRPSPAVPTTAAPAGRGPAATNAVPGPAAPAADTLRAARDSSAPGAASGNAGTAARADTVRVTSPLYTYGVSTAGGRLVEARLHRHRSMAPEDSGATAQILPKDSRLLGLPLVVG